MENFQVYAEISTPVGKFTGYASDYIPDFDEACNERNRIQELLRNCDSFTIFSDTQIGTEITLSRTVIDTSVFEFSVEQRKVETI
jgi:hypothetical protein